MESHLILRKENSFKVVKNKSAAKSLQKNGYIPVAMSTSKEAAHQLIAGTRTQELVDTLLSGLSDEQKLLVKLEITSIATDLHNGLIS